MINDGKKKGQIEMFGLAVIVVMFILGLFIYISFKANNTTVNPEKSFKEDKMPSDFVLAILHVNIEDCPQFTVNDMIIDCARDHRLSCNGKNSCWAVNDSVTDMLNKTFEARGMKFRFYSKNLPYVDETGTVAHFELFNVSYMSCIEGVEQGKSGRAVISTYPAQTVFLYLNVCT